METVKIEPAEYIKTREAIEDTLNATNLENHRHRPLVTASLGSDPFSYFKQQQIRDRQITQEKIKNNALKFHGRISVGWTPEERAVHQGTNPADVKIKIEGAGSGRRVKTEGARSVITSVIKTEGSRSSHTRLPEAVIKQETESDETSPAPIKVEPGTGSRHTKDTSTYAGSSYTVEFKKNPLGFRICPLIRDENPAGNIGAKVDVLETCDSSRIKVGSVIRKVAGTEISHKPYQAIVNFIKKQKLPFTITFKHAG